MKRRLDQSKHKFLETKFILSCFILLILAAATSVVAIDFNIKLIGMILMNLLVYYLVVQYRIHGVILTMYVYIAGFISIGISNQFQNNASNAVMAFQLATIISVFYLYTYVEKKEIIEEKLYNETIIDALTGAYNKRYYEYRISEEISRAKRSNGKVAVAICDIDNFKEFNDTMGHKAGDELLINFVKEVKQHSHGDEVFCRYGGDEFVFIIGAYNETENSSLYKRFYHTIKAVNIKNNNQYEKDFSVSTGVAIYPDDADNKEELFEYADKAMYLSKKVTGALVTRYNKEDQLIYNIESP